MPMPNDGGPAFPVLVVRDDPEAPLVHVGGMFLRDWFAGQALCGLLVEEQSCPIGTKEEDMPSIIRDFYAQMAKCSYTAADAMLAERQRDRTNEAPAEE